MFLKKAYLYEVKARGSNDIYFSSYHRLDAENFIFKKTKDECLSADLFGDLHFVATRSYYIKKSEITFNSFFEWIIWFFKNQFYKSLLSLKTKR